MIKKTKTWFDQYRLLRVVCQTLFLMTCLLIGVKFFHFAGALQAGMIPEMTRPPGVEAFLPISALVSLKYFVLTGIINEVHPSGLMIFLFILFSSFLIKKSFCAWVCPIGLLNEWLLKLHFRLFRKGIIVPRVLDTILRSIKYALLAFFLYNVFYKMPLLALKQFIFSSYNIIADVKMLMFFTRISATAAVIIGLLFVLSFVIPNFWCRYLCPYGALLGGLSFLSPFKVRRNESTCTSCLKCDKVCPTQIIVSKHKTVISDECFACGKCTDACPEKDTLHIALPGIKWVMKPLVLFFAVLLIYSGGCVFSRKADIWQNKVPPRVYLGAMLEYDLIDLSKIEDLDQLINHLDRRGKRALMMNMMQGGAKTE